MMPVQRPEQVCTSTHSGPRAPHEFYKALVAHGVWKFVAHMPEYGDQVVGFENVKAHVMKPNDDRHHFAHGKVPGTPPSTLSLDPQLTLLCR